jgi:hypothetical protein
VTEQTITIGFTVDGGLTLLAALDDAAEYRREQGDLERAGAYWALGSEIAEGVLSDVRAARKDRDVD